MKKTIVVGANFGDEGKGLMTDFFASKEENSLVIRFNGGAQAGHTVEIPGKRHIFGHFGSGTLANKPTYLSEFFIVNPPLFMRELFDLKNKGIRPRIDIDRDCMVTTPYDMIINQLAEEYRGDKKHGSCGIGINETIQRNSDIHIHVGMLWDKDILLKQLKRIQKDYIYDRLKTLGIKDIPIRYMELFNNEEIVNRYLEDVEGLMNYACITDFGVMSYYDHLIFEGAQGLLLDQNHEYFPHVTRSNTGIENAVKLINDFDISEDETEIIYVTRTYMTRHGAGPFPTEIKGKPYSKVEDKTNVPNPFQDTLRYGDLDLDYLAKSISKDLQNAENLKNYKVKLAVTCMDQLDDDKVIYYLDGKLRQSNANEFEKLLVRKTGIQLGYLSYGPTRDKVVDIAGGN